MPKTRSTYSRKRVKTKIAEPVEESDIFLDICSQTSSTNDEIERTQILPDITDIPKNTADEDLAAKIPVCFVCERALLKNGKPFTQCFACQSQSHLKCVGVSAKEITDIHESGGEWNCQNCIITNSKRDTEISLTSTKPEECKICHSKVASDERGLFCEAKCDSWYHAHCVGIKPKRYTVLINDPEPWSCNKCRMQSITNKPEKIDDIGRSIGQSIIWGDMKGIQTIDDTISEMYAKIAGWIPNLFLLPSGKEGKQFIDELQITLKHFSDNTPYQRIAITSFLAMPPLLLQKSTKNSKTAENKQHLKRRLDLWKAGNIQELFKECELIQKRLRKSLNNDATHISKVFSRLMLEGKVSSAMRWLTSKSTNGAPVGLNEDIMTQLQAKHPKARDPDESCMLQGPLVPPDPVRFDELDEGSVYNAAKNLSGSGGPSGLNADGLKRILCSRSFGKNSKSLCYEVARVARRMCTEEVEKSAIKTFTACRLIPLSKDSGTGIRPIGIGEVFHRLIGKTVMKLVKPDVMEAAGPLQACSGQRAGCEAAIHAMRKVYQSPETECVMLIDATNAFNCMNRQIALHNIDYVCPPLSLYLKNTYQQPADLFIRDNGDVAVIKSNEGTTQGDPPASGWYALSTVPIIEHLKSIEHCSVSQAWFADDSSAGGKLTDVLKVWKELQFIGPGYGYFPNARKTVLIVKEEYLEKAKELFGEEGVVITTEGQRHLGAAIGSAAYREKYINSLVADWVNEVEVLSEFAKSDPHACYAAFTFGLVHKWSYFQRTVPESSSCYEPLERAIRNKLIPTITGRSSCSDAERELYELPCRLGGLGISNPVKTADEAFQDSIYITEPLVKEILNNSMILDQQLQTEIETRLKARVSAKGLKTVLTQKELMKQLPDHLRRMTQLNSEKGASCWLTTLPLLSCGFYLNKRAFHDSLCLRYSWKIDGMAITCECGERNSINHALICKKGGFVIRRHNEIRDLEAELLDEVCISVTKEPQLMPLSGQVIRGNTAPEARLDVSAVGFWRPQEKMFVDVRVFEPCCKSYDNLEPVRIYAQHERQKKLEYNDRVINVERGTLTPLIFSTTGGWGREATRFHKQMARLIAEKRRQEYGDVMNFIRKRIRFTMLRTILESLRGTRGIRKKYMPLAWKIADLDYNLIDCRDNI